MEPQAEKGRPPDPAPSPEREEWRGSELAVATSPATTTPAPVLQLGGDEFPDEALAVICRFLSVRELGRLACVSRRFTRPTMTEPGGEGGALLSLVEEGARLRLLLVAAAAGIGRASSPHGQSTWMRALWYAECCLAFTSCGPDVELSGSGARWRQAACTCCPTACVDRCHFCCRR